MGVKNVQYFSFYTDLTISRCTKQQNGKKLGGGQSWWWSTTQHFLNPCLGTTLGKCFLEDNFFLSIYVVV